MEADRDPQRDFRVQRLEAFAARGFPATERTVRDSAGRGTFLLEHGSGPALLLVHGGVGVTAEWAPIAARLPGRVIIPDRPGFGLSEPRGLAGRTLREDSAEWVAGLLDGLGLGLDRVDLVGSSMGGYVAISFTLAHPERVRSLVLTGAPAGLTAWIGLFLHLWGAPVTGAVVSRMMPHDVEAVRRRAFGEYVVHPERVPDDILRIALAGIRVPGWVPANREILRAVTTIRGWRPSARLDEDLAASTVPTTFVLGDRDVVAARADIPALAGRMAHAEVRGVAEAGHIPHLDRPEVVAEILCDVLRDPRLR